MRISLQEFGLQDGHDGSGDVTYKSIAYDINSGREIDGFAVYCWFACGYKTLEDGTDVGVFVHGTRDDIEDQLRKWKAVKLLHAPSDESIKVTSTQFHFVESLPTPFIRLVGAFKAEESGDRLRGFMYEGWHNGEGDWYPITVPGSEETVVRGSCGDILICDALDNTDAIHIYSLEGQKWSEVRTNYAAPWQLDEVFEAGDGLFIIRGRFDDGKEFNLSWKRDK